MLIVSPGVTNTIMHSLVGIADGLPITGGSASGYLMCVTGSNAGKYWDASTNTWEALSTSIAMSHLAAGEWCSVVDASAWDEGVRYRFWAVEASATRLDIQHGEDILCTAFAASTATILARLGAWTGTGINTVLGGIRALAAKAAALTPSDLSDDTTFDNTTDSQEAIRDNTAWNTATGFATPTNVTDARDHIESHGDTEWLTANGFATLTNVTDARDHIETHGDANWGGGATPLVVTVPGSAVSPYGYCDGEDVIQCYGERNVEAWADLDNDGDETKISNRIAQAIVSATAHIDDTMRDSIYEIPFTTGDSDDTVPRTIADLCAMLAGVWLYESRGVVDFDPNTGQQVHRLSWQRRRCQDTLEGLHRGALRLDAVLTDEAAEDEANA